MDITVMVTVLSSEATLSSLMDGMGMDVTLVAVSKLIGIR